MFVCFFMFFLPEKTAAPLHPRSSIAFGPPAGGTAFAGGVGWWVESWGDVLLRKRP